MSVPTVNVQCTMYNKHFMGQNVNWLQMSMWNHMGKKDRKQNNFPRNNFCIYGQFNLQICALCFFLTE